MINKSEIIEALNTGHKAPAVLRDILKEVADGGRCFFSYYDFEESELFSDCGQCIVCIAKEIIQAKIHS